MIDKRRILQLKSSNLEKGPVMYWMCRDFRNKDNWSLLYAIHEAISKKRPLLVVLTNLREFFYHNTIQNHFFHLVFSEVTKSLENDGISTVFFNNDIEKKIITLINEINPYHIITDFFPLNAVINLQRKISKETNAWFSIVDSHNIVPVFYASQKQEFGAYTIRPKINRLLPAFLSEFPKPSQDFLKKVEGISLSKNQFYGDTIESVNIFEKINVRMKLSRFIDERIDAYSSERNNPNSSTNSGFSYLINTGILSAQRIALEVLKSKATQESKDVFLEELIIRRELSENFCFYNKDYDNFNGFPAWAKETLNKHKKDEREFIYKVDAFENAKTHDPIWNTAQELLKKTGGMHGYVRMYWAKKILEWSDSPEDALQIAQFLNDKYALDGNCPNGFTGIAWSIGGVHDRAWGERPVFGKIRYMNDKGCRRKFDVEKFIDSNK